MKNKELSPPPPSRIILMTLKLDRVIENKQVTSDHLSAVSHSCSSVSRYPPPTAGEVEFRSVNPGRAARNFAQQNFYLLFYEVGMDGSRRSGCADNW